MDITHVSDFMDLVLKACRNRAWRLAGERNRDNLIDIRHGVNGDETLRFYELAKTPGQHGRIRAILSDGIYTPWKSNLKHGGDHHCPYCQKPHADVDHLYYHCARVRHDPDPHTRYVLQLYDRTAAAQHPGKKSPRAEPQSLWCCGVVPRNLLVQPRSREMMQRIEEMLPAAGIYDPDADPVKVYTDGGCDPKGRAGPRASYGAHWPSQDSADAWGAAPGKNQSSGAGEAMAAAVAFTQATRPIHLVTDSTYVRDGICALRRGQKTTG